MGEPDLRTPGAWRQTASLELVRRVMDLAPAVRHAVAKRAGLSESELQALEHLSTGPLGPAEIARRLDVSTAASTGIVDRLVERGHVTRQPHATDRRRTEVVLTASAREEVLRHLAPMFLALARLDGDLAEGERAVVVRYLQGVIDAADAVTRPTSPDG